MYNKIISEVKNNEGTVRLYEVTYKDGSIGYDVFKSTNSITTSKNICGLKNLETACKRYNKYTMELVKEYVKKYA